MTDFWKGKNIVVTGCASFIGSHLCEELVRRGARVWGYDDLSSGKLENLSSLVNMSGASLDKFWGASLTDKFEFWFGDLFQIENRFWGWIQPLDAVFHLAAVHGGRGYVDRQQALISSNFALDQLCFYSAQKANAKKIVFASSGCVYPNYLQKDPNDPIYLEETDVPGIDKLCPNYLQNQGYDADGIYGWAKLMAEFTLQAFHKAYGMDTCSCRYFTAYGPRAKEDHAVMAMIARAYSKQDPFEIWGDGTQIRNWTYIDDIVNGTLLAAEKITDGRGVNIGTMERTSVEQAAFRIMGLYNSPRINIKYLLDMPTGPMNRVASNELIKSLGYGEFISFDEGIQKTIDWYVNTKTPEQAAQILKEGSLIDGRAR